MLKFQHSTTVLGPIKWNYIPPNVQEKPSFNICKTALRNYILSNYKLLLLLLLFPLSLLMISYYHSLIIIINIIVTIAIIIRKLVSDVIIVILLTILLFSLLLWSHNESVTYLYASVLLKIYIHFLGLFVACA